MPIKKNLIYIFQIFSLFLSTIIPLSKGCIFDFIIIPLSFIYWILNFYLKRKLNKLQLLIRIIISISFIQTLYSVLISNTNILLAVGIFSRISNLLILIDLIIFNCKLNNFNKTFFKSLIYSYIYYVILISNWGLLNNLLSLSPRVGFPLYGGGVDPHVLGPAMVISLILICIIIINPEKFLLKNNTFNKIILFYAGLSSFITAISTGSRGSLLVLIGFLIFTVLTNFQKINITEFKLSRKIYFKYNFLNFILFGMSSIIIISIVKYSKDIIKIIYRTFSIFDIFIGEDVSRSVVIKRTFDTLFESYNYLLGSENVRQTWDNGVLFLLNNQGLIICFLFFLLLSKFIKYLYPINSNASAIVFASMIFTLIASETIFIPRFFIIYLSTIYILTFPHILENEKKLKDMA